MSVNANKKPEEVDEVRRMVSNAATRLIDVTLLKVDYSYQRALNPIHKYIALHFNEKAFHVIKVAEREDGSLWVVDGQQRLAAYRLMGKTHILAHVFASTGAKEEAQVYVEMNRRRVSLKPIDIFRGMLEYDDPTAKTIVAVAKKCGFKVATSKLAGDATEELRASTLGCHGTLVQVMERKEKEGSGYEPGTGTLLADTLKIIAACWVGVDAKRTHADMVAGIASWLVFRQGNFDLDRVKKKFVKFKTADSLMYYANKGTGDRGKNIADKLEEMYTKGSKK